MTRTVPAHIRAAIQRDGAEWTTADGIPAIVALGMVAELVRCPVCSFHKPAGEECSMCDLLADGE